jgi:hypothetical protein
MWTGNNPDATTRISQGGRPLAGASATVTARKQPIKNRLVCLEGPLGALDEATASSCAELPLSEASGRLSLTSAEQAATRAFVVTGILDCYVSPGLGVRRTVRTICAPIRSNIRSAGRLPARFALGASSQRSAPKPNASLAAAWTAATQRSLMPGIMVSSL